MKKDDNKYSRREFIQKTAAGAAVITVTGIAGSCSVKTGKEGEMPTRVLGKTGLDISILSFGGGSQFLKNKDGEWEKLMHKALKAGVNFFDTAPSYTLSQFHMNEVKGIGSAEERFGKILPEYRDKVIISTKVEGRNTEEAKKGLEESLRKLKTDHVDILFLHSIEPSDEVAAIEKGVYREMIKMKESGLTKFNGFSSMDSAERSRDLLEALDWDVVLLAMNATQYGDFAKVALPVAKKKNVGVVAMKVMRNLVGKKATAQELFEYAWTQEGVASAIVGHYGKDPLNENIKIAMGYGAHGNTAMVDRAELEQRMAEFAGPHALVWARPGYRDGGLIV
jgi:predicted aldo/keto reductase-like oxidoreductase